MDVLPFKIKKILVHVAKEQGYQCLTTWLLGSMPTM
jgi:hypothetical protein